MWRLRRTKDPRQKKREGIDEKETLTLTMNNSFLNKSLLHMIASQSQDWGTEIELPRTALRPGTLARTEKL